MDSKLQIISGRFRGRKLSLPPDARPTQNRARIALFNMLESGLFDFQRNFTVWDTCAGSGAFGIECISRYAGAHAIFTDVANSSLKIIRQNLATVSAGAAADVVAADALTVVHKYGPIADMVFLDPPYADANIGAVFTDKLARSARSGTILVWEIENGTDINMQKIEKNWEVLRDKVYGRARFLILERKSE